MNDAHRISDNGELDKEKTPENQLHRMVLEAADDLELSSYTRFVENLGINKTTYARNVKDRGCTSVNAKGIAELALYFKLSDKETLNLVHTDATSISVAGLVGSATNEQPVLSKGHVITCIVLIILTLCLSFIFLQVWPAMQSGAANSEGISYDKEEGYRFVDSNNIVVQKYSVGWGSDMDLSQFVPTNKEDRFLADDFAYSFNLVTIYRKANLIILNGTYDYYPKHKPAEKMSALWQGFGTVSGDWAAISYISQAKQGETFIGWTGAVMLDINNSAPAEGFYLVKSDADDPATEQVELGSGFILGKVILHN